MTALKLLGAAAIALGLTVGAVTSPAQAAPEKFPHDPCSADEIRISYVGIVDGLNTWTLTNRASFDDHDYRARFSLNGASLAVVSPIDIGAGQSVTVKGFTANVNEYIGVAPAESAETAECGAESGPGAGTTTKRGR